MGNQRNSSGGKETDLSYHNIVEFADASTCSHVWWRRRERRMTFGLCRTFSGTRAFVFKEPVLFEIAYTLG